MKGQPVKRFLSTESAEERVSKYPSKKKKLGRGENNQKHKVKKSMLHKGG